MYIFLNLDLKKFQLFDKSNHLVNELVEALILLDDCREGSHSIGRKAVVSIHERALTGRLGLDLHEI